MQTSVQRDTLPSSVIMLAISTTTEGDLRIERKSVLSCYDLILNKLIL